MKKILLISAMALASFSAKAQFFGGYMPMMPPPVPVFTTPPPVISWNSTPTVVPQYPSAPPVYSNDPCVNAAIGVAMSEQRLRNEGITITHPRENNESNSTATNSTTKDKGWYDCCSGVATFGIDSYHKCPNCGVVHKVGTSHHICKRQ